METNGGGWTLIQRRKIGLLSFNRDWKNYKSGFGSIRGDFWLGNDHIVRLTRQPTVLRIEMEVSVGATGFSWNTSSFKATNMNIYFKKDNVNARYFTRTVYKTPLHVFMQDWEGQTRYAEYSLFNMANELNSYKLFIANYSGNAGDSLRYHNTTNFSTINRDNDKCVDDCAALRKGEAPQKPRPHIQTNYTCSTLAVNLFPPSRWLLVQLLHRLQPERYVLPLWRAHKENRWDHLVRLARPQLLPEESGDEDPAGELPSIERSVLVHPTSKCRGISLMPAPRFVFSTKGADYDWRVKH